jgi:hypothetical protein
MSSSSMRTGRMIIGLLGSVVPKRYWWGEVEDVGEAEDSM